MSRHVDVHRVFEKAREGGHSESHRDKPYMHSMAYASRYSSEEIPKYELPGKSRPAEATYQLIHDELILNSKAHQNMATFVTTWMEPQAEKLMVENMPNNLADTNQYPQTMRIQNRCVSMISAMFNAPSDSGTTAVGTSCNGSSEAILLALLAMKFLWKNRRKEQGKSTSNPNVVFGNNAHVSIEKFARYFDVEGRMVPVNQESHFVMDVNQVRSRIDENTIGVVAILGSTFTGQFEDVAELSKVLDQVEKEQGFSVPIHVDAASGGFVAPFMFPDCVWDFRLSRVKSINVSGHKYGLVYPGVGWVVWREKESLPEDLIFHLDYLGGDLPTYTLNFSRSSSNVVGQFYNFLRLGKEGYKDVMSNCTRVAVFLSRCLEATGVFKLRSEIHRTKENNVCAIPLVAFSLSTDPEERTFDEEDLSKELQRFGWIVPAYNLPPDSQDIKILRVVIRESHTEDLVEKFVEDLVHALKDLEDIRTKMEMKAASNEWAKNLQRYRFGRRPSTYRSIC